NRSLGLFELTDIPPAPRGVPEIAVTFSVDADGLVHAAAKDLTTGHEEKIEIVASSGLSEAEIDAMLRESRVNQQQKERLAANTRRTDESLNGVDGEVAEAHQQLRSAVFITQFKLDTHGGHFRGPARKTLEECLQSSREVLEGTKDPTKLRNALMALETVAAVFEAHLEHEAA
ncbi:MAG: Hsp70 family protein, partial [Bdellovibrionales bacterium]|nr:Hsp70 family protein [Bdellovibrionales bacterium]